MRSLAQQYAGALADVALERRKAEPLQQELRDFLGLFGSSFELRNFLATPAVDRATKQRVIEKLVARMGASTELRNFLFVVVEHQRSNLLPEIGREFEAELRERMGVARADITSARELSAQQKSELSKTLEKLTGKKIELNYGVREELIGGVVVRIGSTIYDGSVRGQLERLGASLTAD